MFNVCLFLAEQIENQRMQASDVAQKLGKRLKSMNTKLKEKEGLIEELQGQLQMNNDENFNNEQTMQTNARLMV